MTFLLLSRDFGTGKLTSFFLNFLPNDVNLRVLVKTVMVVGKCSINFPVTLWLQLVDKLSHGMHKFGSKQWLIVFQSLVYFNNSNSILQISTKVSRFYHCTIHNTDVHWHHSKFTINWKIKDRPHYPKHSNT